MQGATSGKENTSQNQPFRFYLEQVKTLTQMKSNLDALSPVAQDAVREKLSRAVKHMEGVVNDFEKQFMKPSTLLSSPVSPDCII